MKLEQSFEVSAPLQRVWETLIDVERVAPCLPGATVTGRNDDGSYNGEFKVKIGPTSAAYSGKLNMESADEDSHHATMQAAGTDKRGQGGAKATIDSSVEEIDAGTTKVNVSTEYHITGRLARFGRGGMIEEISNRLLQDFAINLQTMLTGYWDGAAESAETTVVAGSAEAADADGVPEGEAAAEAPISQAGSEDEPGDPFAPPVPAPPPSGTAAGNAPPPPSPPKPPPAAAEPVQGLSLVGGAVLSQIKRHAIPLAGALVAILVALGLLRRRGHG